MKIIKIGSFDSRGMPTNWHIECAEMGEREYVLGIDLLFPGSVDVNGVEIVEWTQARKDALEGK